MTAPSLHATRCAICGIEDAARELYAANFDPGAFNPAVFSARRLPDRLHYRTVRCGRCGLVRADPVADASALAELYAKGAFTYGREVRHLANTYGKQLAGLERFGVRKDAILEIGCGNGFLLEEALKQGYRTVRGVEPGHDATQAASPAVQPFLVESVMRPGLFPPDSFDVVCMFQVLDHMPDPASLLDECLRVLRPGGLMLCMNHNVEAVSARLMGERSPIVDIEHTYLFAPGTMRRLFGDHGFQVEAVGAVCNIYPLSYVARLLPMPNALKRGLLSLLDLSRLGRVTLPFPLGNLKIVARKPGAPDSKASVHDLQ